MGLLNFEMGLRDQGEIKTLEHRSESVKVEIGEEYLMTIEVNGIVQRCSKHIMIVLP